jgi:hypothetical protein
MVINKKYLFNHLATLLRHLSTTFGKMATCLKKKWRCDYKNMILFKQEVSEAFVNIVPLDKNDHLS